MNGRILIVYYSWSGNTVSIAEHIQQKTDGQLFELTPVRPYPRDYGVCVRQAKKEIRSGFMPELEAMPEELGGSEFIFVGTPIWWYTLAPPVLTFLENADLSGKTVIPFCTHGGGGKGHYIDDVIECCPDTFVLDDFEVYGGVGRSVERESLLHG